jgi:mRNA interferase HigB
LCNFLFTITVTNMRVRFIRKETIESYVRANASAKKGFEEWLSKIQVGDWENLNDIKNTFNHADLLGDSSNRVVFDIGGNKYRMICVLFFGELKVHLSLRWIGTHADYTKLEKGQKQYTAENYKDYEPRKGA